MTELSIDRLIDAVGRWFERRGASIENAHAACVYLIARSIERLLIEAAAVDAIEPAKEWLLKQIELIRLFVVGWQPGKDSDDTAREIATGEHRGRVH
jgi:hypothetical protein